MPKKEDLLAKIEGLVLVTEENREHLKKLVEEATDEATLKKLEALIDEEKQVIDRVITTIIETELETGDPTILQVIDDALKDIKKTEKTAKKVQEGEERSGEQEKAESLLSQY